MNRLTIIVIAIASLLTVGVLLCAGDTISPVKAQPATDVERVNAANKVFASAVETRNIGEIDKIWAHVPYATFIGPLSTVVVVGWAVGMEKVQLLRKDGKTVAFDAFVTNVFENHDGRWRLVSHQATPVFSEAK